MVYYIPLPSYFLFILTVVAYSYIL